ncbi:hypothetical protein Misp02_18150 [Microtetraspora sp. NBRC 16547]|nr:hypothetical protein Misp02_18150 [Microtetraspora sp. NBRC 16547]
MEAADLAALQLPIGLVGYQTDAVDETLHRVGVALGERDLHIAALEQRVAELVTARLYGHPQDAAVPAVPPEPEHSAYSAALVEPEGPANASGDADRAEPAEAAEPAGDAASRPEVATAAATGTREEDAW